MDKYKKAFEQFRNYIEDHNLDNYRIFELNFMLMKELVEKNTPIKVEKTPNTSCPNCNSSLGTITRYCYNCGQRLGKDNETK